MTKVKLTWGQRILLLILTSIVALFFIPAVMMWDKSKIEVSSLATIESEVIDIGLTEIKIGRGNSKSEVVYLKLEGLDIDFGINYTDSAMRQSYLKRIDRGDKVKILFDKMGQEVPEGLNLHIYQLEHNGVILIKEEDVRKRSNNFSKILLGLGTFFMIWPILLYRYIRKQNIKKLNL